MDKAKHTPTPWRVGIKETGGFRPKSGERRMEIACLPSAYFDALDIFGPEDNSDDPLPNAEFIVEAVNSHYQMKADLERARKALEPFAKLAAVAHPDHRDTRPFIFAFDTAVAQRLTIGDLRAARAALAEIAH